jgi:hypothetical protein
MVILYAKYDDPLHRGKVNAPIRLAGYRFWYPEQKSAWMLDVYGKILIPVLAELVTPFRRGPGNMKQTGSCIQHLHAAHDLASIEIPVFLSYSDFGIQGLFKLF